MSSIALTPQDRTLVAALRKSKGTATLGDVVAATGLPSNDVESGLKSLLETHQGHLAVSESGELLYQFDRKLIEREHIPAAERIRTALWSGFQKAFKVGISVVLVVYFVIFVALVIAALFANKDDRRGGRKRFVRSWRKRKGTCALRFSLASTRHWVIPTAQGCRSTRSTLTRRSFISIVRKRASNE